MNDLKRLISKLKAEGDVTSQEAFEVWKKFFLYDLKGRISDIRDLTVWYRIAHMLLAKGKKGHFIESVPTERCNVSDRKMSSAIEGCRRYIEAKTEEIEIGRDAPFENVSFSDLTFHEGRMLLFRCGIAPLLEGRTEYPEKEPCFRTFDGVRLLELSEKDDITKEEADWIYDYADLANTNRFYKFDCKPLQAWFNSVFKKLAAGKRGNFLYTLPNDTNMNLYQLRDPVERCLKMLPKEPSKVVVRCNDRLPVKDDCLDAKSLTTTGASDRYVYYFSGRYGFFDRNGIDMNEWHPVAEYKDGVFHNVFDDFRGKPILGKLRFAESLGIEYIVMCNNKIAVHEENYDKMIEIINIPDNKIMQASYAALQKELEETNILINTEERLKITMREDGIPLKYVVKGVEAAYNEQKEKEKYLDKDEWLEIDR